MKRRDKNKNSDYTHLKQKLFIRFAVTAGISFFIIFLFYKFVWYQRGGNKVLDFFQKTFGMNYYGAYDLYQQIFRNHAEWIMMISGVIVFFILLYVVLDWFTKYFDIVNQGIDALLSDDAEICLPSEMATTERKLRAVKSKLKQRALEMQLAERKKNDLVMYLAHDIRTPLTSVIGYLNLLSEAPDMPAKQREKYTGIVLEKSFRLEKMINEFFEITRYNMQQIHIHKEQIDLYYMLVQLSDELSPLLQERGNTAILKADENLTICGDPDKLARVFNNILKNAAAYSYPDTEIYISAEEKEDFVVISFTNQGKTIPEEKLLAIFEKFYRLDESRASRTGGTGLGLAIAKEIVSLHGGTISAESRNDIITFTIALPAAIHL